uniref:Uncharacterized protein n=1 Tax=Timema tahoe TaxID=61484 RepID=A0A7R9P0F9_9NEOP|nr:unnamed protein product [Timema tahoe]
MLWKYPLSTGRVLPEQARDQTLARLKILRHRSS